MRGRLNFPCPGQSVMVLGESQDQMAGFAQLHSIVSSTALARVHPERPPRRASGAALRAGLGPAGDRGKQHAGLRGRPAEHERGPGQAARPAPVPGAGVGAGQRLLHVPSLPAARLTQPGRATWGPQVQTPAEFNPVRRRCWGCPRAAGRRSRKVPGLPWKAEAIGADRRSPAPRVRRCPPLQGSLPGRALKVLPGPSPTRGEAKRRRSLSWRRLLCVLGPGHPVQPYQAGGAGREKASIKGNLSHPRGGCQIALQHAAPETH